MSFFEINITAEIPKPRFSPVRLKKNVRAILKTLGWKKAALSLLLTGDRGIRKLNKKYLRHDRPTDVIAFGQLEGKALRTASGARPFLGDIAVSMETAARRAAGFGNSFDYELHFYFCHGILHLMGWRDKTAAQRKRMLAKQAKILKKIGIKP